LELTRKQRWVRVAGPWNQGKKGDVRPEGLCSKQHSKIKGLECRKKNIPR